MIDDPRRCVVAVELSNEYLRQTETILLAFEGRKRSDYVYILVIFPRRASFLFTCPRFDQLGNAGTPRNPEPDVGHIWQNFRALTLFVSLRN
jgi:hypothetical protein